MTPSTNRVSERPWLRPRAAIVGPLATALLGIACGNTDSQQLGPDRLAMVSKNPDGSAVAPFYNDGEVTLYETQLPVNLPITKPTADESKTLGGRVGPFAHHPWVTADQVQLQLTWTLANLDKDSHAVEVVVDPWNEFGRYVAGVQIEGDDSIPDLSGIDEGYDLPGLGSGRSSRIEHTFSFDEMNELAVDFATAINILTTVKAPPPMAGQEQEDDPRVGMVNYVFNLQNHHGDSPLTDSYIPAVIPGLLGFDIGLLTHEPANIAIEFTIEIIANDPSKVIASGNKSASLIASQHIYTLTGL